MAAYRTNAALRAPDAFDDNPVAGSLPEQTEAEAEAAGAGVPAQTQEAPEIALASLSAEERLAELQRSLAAQLASLMQAQARATETPQAPAGENSPHEPPAAAWADRAYFDWHYDVSASPPAEPLAGTAPPSFPAQARNDSRARYWIAFGAGLGLAMAFAGAALFLVYRSEPSPETLAWTLPQTDTFAAANRPVQKLQSRVSDAERGEPAAKEPAEAAAPRVAEAGDEATAPPAPEPGPPGAAAPDAQAASVDLPAATPVAVQESAPPPPPAWPAVTIREPLLDSPTSEGGGVPPVAASTARVVRAVNLRAGPGNSEAVLGIVPAGASVDVIGCRHWCEVVFEGQRGWLYRNFLESAADQ
jgi:hypothetical protein